MLAVFDAASAVVFAAPELFDLGMLTIMRIGTAAVLPIVVLLLIGLLSHEAKARLVYWKITDPLPGSAAFTKYAPADARIDMKALAKNVGLLPVESREQNAKWYKLYRQVNGDAAVVHTHQLYLMYRDMAAMSLFLIPLLPTALWYAGASFVSSGIVGGALVLQYIASAIGARHSGTRLVCNVLAIHATAKMDRAAR